MKHLRLERFTAALRDGKPDARTAAWMQAMNLGFHEEPMPEAGLLAMTGAFTIDGRTLTGVYDEHVPGLSLNPQYPVGTYGSLVKSLNTGGGNLLRAHLITAVTVRPSHRRRGILRRMITEDLALAKANGLAIAALTASEATIYGRYGFGRATAINRVQLSVRDGIGLLAPAAGSVIAADPASLLELGPRIFAAQHAATAGSIDHPYFYTRFTTGEWADEEQVKPLAGLRAAIHLGPGGEPDGYVTYVFAGWDKKPAQLKIKSLVAANAAARHGLWEYLGAHDLIECVTGPAPIDDALPWTLTDARAYEITASHDHLWLRILDVPAALASRPYAHDGTLVLRVRDSLGHASGTFGLRAASGSATVELLAEESDADIELDVTALSSLFLGGVPVRRLAEAGRIAGGSEVLAGMAELFAVDVLPYCETGF
ncbi:GNAT family N-acetyltransferase [Paeniglutamicibacter cryotolerans]|nr:GNAT family N-acetyltransferase [Paeniglutamicibacter cryotolerans]